MFGKKFIWEAEYITLNFGLKGFDQSYDNMSWWVFAPFGEVFRVRNELREENGFQVRKKGKCRKVETHRVEKCISFSPQLLKDFQIKIKPKGKKQIKGMVREI